jgi:hypothetical protein
MAEVSSLFVNLEVEEPAEALQDTIDTASTQRSTEENKVHYQAERPDGPKEDFLAFRLLLSDLNKLRTEVERTWESYKQGMLDIVAASITTNTAVDLARSLEDEYQSLFVRRGGVIRMLAMFYHAQCAAAKTTEDHKEKPGDEMNFKLYDIADEIFWVPLLLLSSFLDVVQPGYLPEIRKGHFGVRDPASNRSQKTAREKLKEDKILLLEMLPEFLVLTTGSKRSPAEDEMTRGLRTAFESKKVTLWLCFAVQVYLDIHNRLREEVHRPFEQLTDVATHARKSIKDTSDFHKDLRIDNWPKQNDDLMVALSEEIMHWILGDPHRTAARELRRKNIPPPYYFFHQHPWLCGLWKYYIQIQFQTLAVGFINAWGSVLCCAHLYNAVRHEDLLTRRWPDMELALVVRQYKGIFVGDAPKQPEDYLKRFFLAVGASVVNISIKSTGRKNKGLILSSRGPHVLKELAPILQTFKERYCRKNPRFNLRAEDVESIVEKSEWQYKFDDEGYPVTLVKDSEPVAGFAKPTAKQVTLTKLIAILRAGVHAEIMELSFDYLLLHKFCWLLLRRIRNTCRDRLIKMYGPDYIQSEKDLPFIIGYIFATATNTQRLGNLMKAKKSEEVTSAVLRDAAEELENMLAEGGGSMVENVMKATLGVELVEVQNSGEEWV